MDDKRVDRILEQVAYENGVSVDEVLFEIEFVIFRAYHNAMLSNNKAVLHLWESIPREGEMPTTAEMIDFLSKKVLGECENSFGDV